LQLELALPLIHAARFALDGAFQAAIHSPIQQRGNYDLGVARGVTK
jgi:hypothetical protein